MAAARKVSPATSMTLLPSARNFDASLPMVVGLPEPLTPATRMTNGFAVTSSGFATRASTFSIAASSSTFDGWARASPREADERLSPPLRRFSQLTWVLSFIVRPWRARDSRFSMTPEEMLGRLLYRDGLMLVIDKPAGIAVHRGPKGGESLDDHFDALRFGLPRNPALAHRLD